MAGSPYITRAGYVALQQELEGLWQRRRMVVTALSAAAAEGDRSENAEYQYRKKELRELDRRLRYLQKRLPELTVVDARPEHTDRVFFAAWVTLERESGETQRYQIVGSDEFDPKRNAISIDSPLARAMLGKQCDDDVWVEVPSGRQHWVVVDIHYDSAPL